MAIDHLQQELRVAPARLRRRLDPEHLSFDSTADVAPLEGTIGQPRALEAIEFGLEIPTAGYSLFVAGPPGSGRTGTMLDALHRAAAERPRPDDWVYVHDFDQADRPRAIRLPAGRGRRLQRDLDEFIEAARLEVGRAFEAEGYADRRREALSGPEADRDRVRREAEAFARERGFGLQPSPTGIVAFPMGDGRPLSPEDVQNLAPEEREELERKGREVQEELAGIRQRARQIEREAQDRVRTLDREVALFAIDPLLHELHQRHADQPELLAHLDRIREDIPEHVPDFRAPEPGHEQAGQPPLALQQAALGEQHLDRYRVNVLVDNGGRDGAPVVVERNPTYYNLCGRVEYRSSLGMMTTDFRQVKAGALQRANGGFLVLEAVDVLRNPFAWEGLKRALRQREVRIENLVEQLALLPSSTISPEPIPLEVKVILIGRPALYRLLQDVDEDFRDLFKVKVDFAPDMEWSDEHVRAYAAFAGRMVRDRGLRHLDRSAVARLVEHGSRLRDHQGKLSTRLLDIADIVAEAGFWAGKAGHDLVTGDDVARAIERKERRSNLLEERVTEQISEGTIRIDTEGDRVGQVNGLSVMDLGDYRFARPSRVTASVSMGRGGVASIEREIELSGPIHSKGVLVLAGYLAGTYAQDWPLALHATLTFEQSYEGVEGDSASSTELYALLSALAGVPLRQSIAVTGSVDQHGEVQAVGGVTHKVEGFFDLCRRRGLTGEQGVLLPATNVRHLMLRDEVTDAVAAGRFHVWAVRHVDQGLALLTGRAPGEPGPDGRYPEGTLHRRVADRLRGYAERLSGFEPSADGRIE